MYLVAPWLRRNEGGNDDKRQDLECHSFYNVGGYIAKEDAKWQLSLMGIECMKSKAIIWRLYSVLNDSDSGTEKVDNRMSSRRIQTGRGDTRQGSITIWNLSRTRNRLSSRKMNQIPKVHTRMVLSFNHTIQELQKRWNLSVWKKYLSSEYAIGDGTQPCGQHEVMTVFNVSYCSCLISDDNGMIRTNASISVSCIL